MVEMGAGSLELYFVIWKYALRQIYTDQQLKHEFFALLRTTNKKIKLDISWSFLIKNVSIDS